MILNLFLPVRFNHLLKHLFSVEETTHFNPTAVTEYQSITSTGIHYGLTFPTHFIAYSNHRPLY